MTSLKEFLQKSEQKVEKPKFSSRGIPLKVAEKKKSSSVLTSPLRPSRAFAPKLAGGEKREENGHSDSKKNNVNNGESIVQQGSLRIPVSCLDSATNAGLGSEHLYDENIRRGIVKTGNGSWDQQAIREIISRDIMQASLGVSFDDVVALRNAKRLLNEAVVLPFVIPEFFSGVRKPWKGVLLFGPPGTGKTMLAKAICGMNNLTFFNCSAATLVNKYWGESEKIARALFAVARERAPSVVFFDEVDAIMSANSGQGGAGDESSRRLKTEILKQMDGIESAVGDMANATVMVLAASNCPWDLDEAFRRRLEKRISVPLPDQKSREQMLQINLSSVPVAEDIDTADLALKMEGFSGADVRIVCREAAMMPLRRLLVDKTPEKIKSMRANGTLDVPKVLESDLVAALFNTRPSVSKKDIERFFSWDRAYGCN